MSARPEQSGAHQQTQKPEQMKTQASTHGIATTFKRIRTSNSTQGVGPDGRVHDGDLWNMDRAAAGDHSDSHTGRGNSDCRAYAAFDQRHQFSKHCSRRIVEGTKSDPAVTGQTGHTNICDFQELSVLRVKAVTERTADRGNSLTATCRQTLL